MPGNQFLTVQKLDEAKSLIRLFGLDYDGTVSDGDQFKQPQVFELVGRILANGKSVAFITARAATALKMLVPPLMDLLITNNLSIPCFVAGGNGATLYEIKKYGPRLIYNNGFKLEHILRVVEAGRKVCDDLGIGVGDLAEKGLETFRKFLQDDWGGYIPNEIIDVCRPYNGEFFTEEAKVTFVLPKDKSLHGKVVTALNVELGGYYHAVAGDDTYVHITRRSEEDGKAVAIKTILNVMGLKENEVATFGDMPCGNDIGLLSFPYSFTNLDEFVKVKEDLQSPPYILLNDDLSPVARVHKAIDYLIS